MSVVFVFVGDLLLSISVDKMTLWQSSTTDTLEGLGGESVCKLGSCALSIRTTCRFSKKGRKTGNLELVYIFYPKLGNMITF